MHQFFLLSIFFVTLVIINTFFLQFLRADSNSMAPGISEGDLVVIDKSDPSRVKRGQLIVFNLPGNQYILKRIVAIAGDRVIYNHKQVYLQRNCESSELSCDGYETIVDQPLSYGKIKYQGYPLSVYASSIDGIRFQIAKTDVVAQYRGGFAKQEGLPYGEWKLPEGHVFVLGDNRDHSVDSRHFGFVKLDAIVGSVVTF